MHRTESQSDRRTPKVTVVIPVYNRAQAVRRAIASVLAQTFQDFEIVVVDDGSTDDSVRSVESIDDPRIRIIRHEGNRGGSAARNTGITAAVAPYVAFLDSDDEWLPTKLQRQIDLFERSPQDVALIYCGVERIYGDGTVKEWVPRLDRQLAKSLLRDNTIGETSIGVVRRSALDSVGGFDTSLPSCQDADLWLRLCQRFEATFVPEVLTRIHKGNDLGRVSVNPRRTQQGRALFCQKHFERMSAEGALHGWLCVSAWREYRHLRDPRSARRLYLQAIRANPLSPVAYVLFALSTIPPQWMDALARLKQALRCRLRNRDSKVEGALAVRVAAPQGIQRRRD